MVQLYISVPYPPKVMTRGYNPLIIFLLQNFKFYTPPPLPATPVSSCLTPAGGYNPAGQLPEIS